MVLKVLGQILRAKVEVDRDEQREHLQHLLGDFGRLRCGGAQVGERRAEELQQRLLQVVEDELDLAVQRVRLELVPIPLEDGVRDLQQRAPLLVVLGRRHERRRRLRDERRQQRLPRLREVVDGDEGDGLRELQLDLAGHAQEELEEPVAHLLLRRVGHRDGRLIGRPVLPHEVFEEDSARLAHFERHRLHRQNLKHCGRAAGLLLELLELRLGCLAGTHLVVDALREALR
mmetsp:Transcript_44279/g.103553  ORF Transcript_44279/g.103553 Transcript_44279/m.103553 type:complete len:231 (+) Transcript_44279:2248-2940(+)